MRRFRVVSQVFSRGRTIPLALLASTAALLLILSACAPATSQPNSGLSGQQNAPSGLNIRLSADKFEFTSAQQFCQTLATAEVVVGSHGTARWNTVDGKLSAQARTPVAVLTGNYRIYTPITFARFVPLVDYRYVATKGFLTVGGQVGQDSYSIDASPTLAGVGGHYVVVLFPSTPHTGGNTEVALVVGYAYPVDAQGIVTLQPAGNPKEPGIGPPQPAITIALASLRQQLAACAS
jgi:hypothetical protein